MVRVPFAEDVVGPAVDRMAVIVGAQVEGQLVEQGRVEVGLGQQGRVVAVEDLQGLVRRASW